jgi:hypothetical protein
MSDDPRVSAAVAYASSPEGSPERKQAFERFAGHFRGPTGSVNVAEMDKWLAARTAATQPKPQPQSAAPPQAPARVSDEVRARMSDAARLDHVRQFDQSKMPAWRDPRGA